MKNIFSRFVQDESGATAIEYGLIAAVIGVGILASLGKVKEALNTQFTSIGTAITGAK